MNAAHCRAIMDEKLPRAEKLADSRHESILTRNRHKLHQIPPGDLSGVQFKTQSCNQLRLNCTGSFALARHGAGSRGRPADSRVESLNCHKATREIEVLQGLVPPLVIRGAQIRASSTRPKLRRLDQINHANCGDDPRRPTLEIDVGHPVENPPARCCAEHRCRDCQREQPQWRQTGLAA
jgi:hypothetical protein